MIYQLLCLATYCLAVMWWMRRRRISRLTQNIPTFPGDLPFLGSALCLIGTNRDVWEFVKKSSTELNDLGGIVKSWFGPTLHVIGISDPDISVAVSNACLQKSYIYDWGKDGLGGGIGNVNVELWKSHRKLLNPAFNQNVLNGFLHIFNRQSKKLVTKFAEYVSSEKFDPRDLIAKISLETICQTAMGLPESKASIVDNQYQDATDQYLHTVVERVRYLWKHPQFIYNLTAQKRKENSYIKIFQKKSSNVGQFLELTEVSEGKIASILEKSKKELQERMAKNNNDGITSSRKFKPFMELLLEESRNGLITDDRIKDEVNTMIAAGYETTLNNLVLTLVMIGSHKNVQEKIYKELQDIFGDSDRDVTKEDLPKLVYMEAVIKECQRLNPVIPLIGRTVHKDIQIGDITFPLGSELIISIWAINRHPCWGADRNEFNPDRWLNPDTLPSNPNAFASFAMGKRNCIGKTYALMSAKVSLSSILRKFQVNADHTKLEFTYNFVLKPVGGEISLEIR